MLERFHETVDSTNVKLGFVLVLCRKDFDGIYFYKV